MNIIGRTYDDLMSDPEYHQYSTNLNEMFALSKLFNRDIEEIFTEVERTKEEV